MRANLEALQGTLGVPLYLVGGMVRDTLMGREPKDWDLTCAMNPYTMMEKIQASGLHVIPTGIQHGTITIPFPEGNVEITSHRSDGDYLDGRRPSEVILENVTLEEDLSRRDFTMNSIAMDLQGNLVDPFGGQEDIKNKTIRAVGEPLKRFHEDGLRPMRALRFMSQLGFTIEEETLNAIPLSLPVFKKVAQERILVEFNKLLSGVKPMEALKMMTSTGLLAVWLPETLRGRKTQAGCVGDCSTLLSRQVTFFRSIRMQGNLESILQRCKFSSKDISDILVLSELDRPLEHNPYHLRKVASRLKDKGVAMEDWLALPYHACFRPCMEKALQDNPPLLISDLCFGGRDLMEMFPEKKPGPWMSQILKDLLEMMLQDPSKNQPTMELTDWIWKTYA